MNYRRLSDHELSEATTVKVQTKDDPCHGEADANKLRAWLSIIALRKKVQTMESHEIQHKPALDESHKLCFSRGAAAVG